MPTLDRRVRISIDVHPGAKRRLNIAAAQHDQSIRDYVWEAIKSRLDRDGIRDVASGDDGRALHAETDPVLAQLWDNPDDARYDDL